ncbi:hypothetical protein [Pseudomonas koreensis]|jgi:hypothetical protein|uniref:hypothetical protein n=1 Tax=Pseudomonas koreensis TaxID=198620 RepID=UPI000E2456B7|nr:hypothetical protein [Pseudomonas koreensis]MBP3998317.1 hypothetical protein [Pseudomonas koreensis]
MIDEQLAILLADWHEQLNEIVGVNELDGWHAALRRTIDDLKASGSIDALQAHDLRELADAAYSHRSEEA